MLSGKFGAILVCTLDVDGEHLVHISALFHTPSERQSNGKVVLTASLNMQEGNMRKNSLRSTIGLTLAAVGTLCLLSMSLNRAWGSDDVATGLGGFEPHNAVVNPLNPSQVAVMQGCTVLISNNYGQDNFPIVWTTDQPANNCGGDPSLAFDSQGRLFVTQLDQKPRAARVGCPDPGSHYVRHVHHGPGQCEQRHQRR